MNPCILDTDVLMPLFKGAATVLERARQHRNEYGFLNVTIITYYEVMKGHEYTRAHDRQQVFEEFRVRSTDAAALSGSNRFRRTGASANGREAERGSDRESDQSVAGAEVNSDRDMTTGQSDVTKQLNQVYAAESSTLDPEWMALVAAVLIDAEESSPMTLEDYAELYNVPLDAEDYRREFPEDEPFTHPPTDDE